MKGFIIGLTFIAALCQFGGAKDVVELTPANFHKTVIDSDELWLVEFFAPWCGHCKALAPEWEKAASILKGIVKVGAVDADAHQGLGQQYKVEGFPTIKIFGQDKFKPVDYQGGRTANDIVNGAMKAAQQMVSARMSGGGRSGGGGGRGSGSGGSKGPGSKEDVIELTDSNFEELVMNSKDYWLVEFFAPWCGHCKNLAPHWQSAASQLKGRIKMGALDATVHTVMASRYGVRGYPTIKVFPAGAKGEPEEYQGGRTADDIVAWVNEHYAEDIPAPEILQITEEKTLKDACEGHQLCIVSVLPHILDCQSECRNKYLAVLKGLGEKFKKQKWGWLWSEAGQQLALEDSLEIGGFGYPALAAVNVRKMKFSLMRGSFGETGINDFLRELSYGRGSTAPLKQAKLPEIVKIDPWDGKDGVLEEEEDIDLSDVELDDLEKDEL